jgi:2,3-bisphosphoglycerate-independent phosphoglycerate mutase
LLGRVAIMSSLATGIAAVSALAAFGSLLVYVYVVRRSGRDLARDEALALAETRAQMVEVLRTELRSVERRDRRALAQSEKQNRELREALERTRAEAREHVYQAQTFYAAVLADLLSGVESDLEARPPDVEGALRRIRKQRPSANPERNVG